MTVQQVREAKQSALLPLMEAFDWAIRKGAKTHDYTHHQADVDYVFEPADSPYRGYLTAQGRGVKPGDYLILKTGKIPFRYRVEQIHYYSNPADMWMGLLVQVL